MRALLLLALIAGCGAPALTIANGIGLGVQSATLACDWGQTRRVADAGWPRTYEENIIMGPRPDPATVDLYFAAALAATGAAWWLAPRRWRPVVSLVVVALQARTLIVSQQSGHFDVGMCGVNHGRS